VARGELTLIKLREKIEGRPRREAVADDYEMPEPTTEDLGQGIDDEDAAPEQVSAWGPMAEVTALPLTDDSLVEAKQSLSEAVETLVGVVANPEFRGAIGSTDRANLAKYLTIAKLRLENAIAMVRSDDGGR
jgi:hypothetical protein